MRKKKAVLGFVIVAVFCSLSLNIIGSEKQEFKLFAPGTEKIVDYGKYGEFQGIGADKYKYLIRNPYGLAKAVGEGVYPNRKIYVDPEYKKLLAAGELAGSPWDFLQGPDYQKNFYKWASLDKESGVKLFFTAVNLKEAGLYLPAVKAYYAAVVHFPGEACWAKDASFVWYIGPAALSAIKNITRQHPELGLELQGARIIIKNANDTNLDNDQVIVNPGKFVSFDPEERKQPRYDVKDLKVTQQKGKGKVRLVQYENGDWQMLIAGRPFFVKGLTFTPTAVGMEPGSSSLNEWMFLDTNNNEVIDAAYESWVDEDENNKQDAAEKTVGDFQLLREMGANAIRIYYDERINKELLRDMHEKYGINVIMGNFLGAYTVGSEASWEKGTDYTNDEQKKRMKENVKKMVQEYKNEPFILMWLLGNENNQSADYTGINATRTNASRYPKEYAQFLNEVAVMIHELDPDHPVATGNMQLRQIDLFNEYATALDILGVNSYRGKEGFGTLWEEVKDTFDRPVMLTEFGCDAYWEGKGEDQEAQADYHRNCWQDIAYNQAGGWGAGNSIGGCVFEWLDEWWKDNNSGDPADRQQLGSQGDMNFPDGRSHEEWFGICGQGDGQNSPFLRQPRKTYYLYKEIWNKR